MTKSISLSKFHVSEVHSEIADQIIKKNHYLGRTPAAAKHRYLITVPFKGILGAAMWGRPVARNEDQQDTLELSRFWTADKTPKNTESMTLGKMMRDLEDKGYERLIAYASTGQGHEGTIYKATNWNKVKKTDRTQTWENRPGRNDTDKSDKIKFEKLL